MEATDDSVYLGLDLSLSSTGFCIKKGGETKVETIKSVPGDFDDDLSRLKHICHEIIRRIPKDVKMICVEDFYTPCNAKQIGSAIKLAMLGTVIRMALYDAKFPFYLISPNQIKKFVTGKGSGPKSMIVMAVYKHYGKEVADDNQADAMVLSHIAKALVNTSDVFQPTKAQSEVIKKVLTDRPRYNC
jgi:Holliday junction resolvasome RuvABC endonuclease subunit